MEPSQRTPIVALAISLLADLRRLVAQELQLAKHQMQQELSKLLKASIQAAVALVVEPPGGHPIVRHAGISPQASPVRPDHNAACALGHLARQSQSESASGCLWHLLTRIDGANPRERSSS